MHWLTAQTPQKSEEFFTQEELLAFLYASLLFSAEGRLILPPAY